MPAESGGHRRSFHGQAATAAAMSMMAMATGIS